MKGCQHHLGLQFIRNEFKKIRMYIKTIIKEATYFVFSDRDAILGVWWMVNKTSTPCISAAIASSPSQRSDPAITVVVYAWNVISSIWVAKQTVYIWTETTAKAESKFSIISLLPQNLLTDMSRLHGAVFRRQRRDATRAVWSSISSTCISKEEHQFTPNAAMLIYRLKFKRWLCIFEFCCKIATLHTRTYKLKSKVVRVMKPDTDNSLKSVLEHCQQSKILQCIKLDISYG